MMPCGFIKQNQTIYLICGLQSEIIFLWLDKEHNSKMVTVSLLYHTDIDELFFFFLFRVCHKDPVFSNSVILKWSERVESCHFRKCTGEEKANFFSNQRSEKLLGGT